MPGFANVTNMTSRQIQRMGHADDEGSTYYRTKTKTQKVLINHKADDVWAAACAAQRINGTYVKLSSLSETPDQSKQSNRQIVESFLANTFTITDEDREQGVNVRSYFQAYTFKILQGKRLNEFDNNAMLIANREVIESNYDLALICSLPASYERGIKQQSVDQRITFAKGGYIGTIGGKVSTTVEVLKSVYSQKWMTNFITGVTNDDQIVFFAYKSELTVGSTLSIQGNVKGQRDNTTQLNRVKVIA